MSARDMRNSAVREELREMLRSGSLAEEARKRGNLGTCSEGCPHEALHLHLEFSDGSVVITDEEEYSCYLKGKRCLVCDHTACGWCPDCSPEVPEWAG